MDRGAEPADLRVPPRADQPPLAPASPVFLLAVEFPSDDTAFQPWHLLTWPQPHQQNQQQRAGGGDAAAAAAAVAGGGAAGSYGRELAGSAGETALAAAAAAAATASDPEIGVYRYPVTVPNKTDAKLLCTERRAEPLAKLRQWAARGGAEGSAAEHFLPVWGQSVQRVADGLWLPLTQVRVGRRMGWDCFQHAVSNKRHQHCCP